ncbi:aldehyde dehydrogenase (NADP(+)) [Zobellia galactanivorans]|uniref:NADP-dependent fatty aldehyde dehydrogenase n=1 Tax=Zobellia galactanivorans (strain DSM 12802 / CCUG 47099 / CIP 106680 / NCIMB 13871 / Dsij) TaxID=63186 RepID=G0L7L6_ZOBGA|nr:aldehyde dehydrogenase (NADP(+)) [Zobellia galactanivorans]CAZ98147.1 NADP-dependent fatty aldehyde dehydrogenase [Zobellia galactanivorans]
MITGKNYIGKDLSSKGNQTYNTFDPNANQATEWTFYEATKEEIDSAVGKADKAFQLYKNLSGAKKAQFLEAIAEEIDALGDELIQAYCKESGLPQGRAMGERGRTMGQLRAFAELLKEGSWVEATIDTAQADRQPFPKLDLRKMLLPIGPIAVFGSSNFPFAFSTAGGDTASALAAGCPVIVKSHPMHAGTGELVSSAIIKAAERTGMPDGVFSNLNSSGIEVGQQLVLHPKVKGVGFTGSIKGGTALYKLANERKEPIPVFAEMGSINPVVVLPSALQEKGVFWAQQYAGSVMLGAGQFCTNPGLILGVKSTSLDAFIDALGEEIEKLEPSCMLHPNIHSNYEKGKEEVSAQGGTDVVAEYKKQTAPNYAGQKVLTVNGVNFLKNPKLHQEVFGPFSLVVRCADANELTEVLNCLEGQLTGTVLGNAEEIERYGSVIDALQGRVGRLIFNGVPTGVEVCPSMQHGGPFPASTDSRFTSVGVSAIKRWVRPVSFQNWPQEALPEALRDNNPLSIMRIVDSEHTNKKIE